MSQANGRNGKRRQLTAEEKATILRRHLADEVPVPDFCDEYHIQPTLFYLCSARVRAAQRRTPGWTDAPGSSPRSRRSISR